MRHLGDITKINGAEIEPVDVIVGGSPCQNMSIAGNRKGLAGDQSVLYLEQLRVVKEMRENDIRNGRTGFYVRPRYMLWENVPGAFSTNKGADFGAVLQETIRIIEPEAPVVPMPKKGWPTSGCLYSDVGEWSLAWRVFDSQYWGVPQRRKRIALIIDFGGMSAPEILFERQGLRWNSSSCGTSRETVARDAQNCVRTNDSEIGRTVSVTCYESHPMDSRITELDDDISPTVSVKWHKGAADTPLVCEQENLSTNFVKTWDARGNGDGTTVSTLTGDHENRITDYSSVVVEELPVFCLQGNGIDRSITSGCNGKGWTQDVSYTLNTVDRHAVARVEPIGINGDIAGTLDASYFKGCGMRQGIEREVVAFAMQAFGDYRDCGVASGLKARDYKDATDLVAEKEPIAIDRAFFNQGQNALYDPQYYEDGTTPTLVARGPSAVCARYGVRRLTPTECERLQGFEDGWTDIGAWTDSKGKYHKESSDSARYKALGNSIALPSWKYVLKRISAQYERDATMGSLFDGIGGFPLIWEKINGKGSARWASEIEEFCIAVTKCHFVDE